MPVPVASRSGAPIKDLTDWQELASTKGKWADGFSAKELARLWLTDCGPQAAIDALKPAFGDLVLDSAIAEAQISFDEYAGGIRNHDVLARGHLAGHSSSSEVVVGIEGKVNESLDATIKRKYTKTRELLDAGENTNLGKRVDDLVVGIFSRSVAADDQLAALRYQLLTAVAGTVAAAGAHTVGAAVVVHLIEAPGAKQAKFDATRKAVADFAAALNCPTEGPLVGPFTVDTSQLKGPAKLDCWLTVIQTPAARSR